MRVVYAVCVTKKKRGPVILTVRVDRVLYERLRREAKMQDRSVSALVRIALAQRKRSA
jgi:hypothetical protein